LSQLVSRTLLYVGIIVNIIDIFIWTKLDLEIQWGSMKKKKAENTPEKSLSYPVGAVVRLTGISPDVLRAWERRHGVVKPTRTEGGTRRYDASDVERLRLVKAAVEAGHRIGRVANLSESELKILSGDGEGEELGRLDGLFDAVDNFDAAEFQRLLSVQLATLGAPRFAREVAPLVLTQIGERWARGELGIAKEHMASAVIRNLIGSTLIPSVVSAAGPRIIFATPPDELHELGLMMAALTAVSAGANCLYLGTDLPVEDVVGAAHDSGAVVVVVSLVTLRAIDARRVVASLRTELSDGVKLWIGGPASAELDGHAGIEHIASLEALEQRVVRLRHAETGGI
jgi:DNA-binding transcriptional MerR regulator/methylmalonyl-CoA mutase cobalamin-binding subunit